MSGTELALGALEIASGEVLGTDERCPPLPAAGGRESPRAALEEVVRRALLRAPCVVSFSGGRDSSALLALAVHVARREELPLPVAVTLRFAECPDSHEDEWQDSVLTHLRVEDRVRLDFVDELDVLGPYSRRLVRAHGVRWPPNVHSHLPIAELAPGGTVITGFGGDELLTPYPLFLRMNQVLTGRVRPRPRDVLRLAALRGPGQARRAGARRWLGPGVSQQWLTPGARRAVLEAMVRSHAAQPLRWDRLVDSAWWRTRYRGVGVASLAAVCGMARAVACNPFAEPTVIAALAGSAGRLGFPTRAAALHSLVGDLLPATVLERTSKAEFGRAFWNRHAMAFANGWDGAGADRQLVDLDALRRMWRAGPAVPDGRSYLLLQTIRHAADTAADTVMR